MTVGLQITKWLSSKKDLKWLKSEQRRLKTKGIETVIVEEKNGTDKKHALCRTDAKWLGGEGYTRIFKEKESK
tara:strand:+ start:80 stop:298 length:219 start_codon:yes stop_codon:yes gene_type:complete